MHELEFFLCFSHKKKQNKIKLNSQIFKFSLKKIMFTKSL